MKNDTIKIIFLTILIAFGLVGVLIYNNNSKITKDSIKFKNEYESLNGQKRAKDGKIIRTISISKNNPMVYTTASNLAKKIDNKESFLVYFGFDDCPWCRSVIESLIETAKENNINKIYYVNVKEIRDVYTLDENNKPVISKEGTKGYNQLLSKLENVLADYTLTTEENKTINVGEKRIYGPNIVAVVNGKAKSLVTGISSKETDPYMTITSAMLKDTKKDFNKVMKYLLKENNSCTFEGSC